MTARRGMRIPDRVAGAGGARLSMQPRGRRWAILDASEEIGESMTERFENNRRFEHVGLVCSRQGPPGPLEDAVSALLARVLL